ncbi:MAG TPA: hypothetical protein PKW79_05005 [Rhabdochlamydiaceae bacterium]|nr:hypothetical protein [Rhabdochlamydiaceae bacterium]
MNRIFTNSLLLTSLFSSSVILADAAEMPPLKAINQNETFFRNGSLGVEVFNVHYRIKKYPNVLFKRSGNYIGLRANVEHRLPNQYYFSFDPIVAIGQNCHRAININFSKRSDDLVYAYEERGEWFDGSFKYGYTFQPALAKHFLISTFMGPGYHIEKNYLGRASWYYGAGGIRMTQDLSETLTLGMDLKTMYAFSVRDDQNLTNVARLGENNFWGLEIGLPITWQLGSTKKFDMRLKPYFLKLNVNSIESILGSTVELGYTY